MPTSLRAATASGLISPGSKPALNASNSSPHLCLKSASAIWLRALFLIQMNKTRGFFISSFA